MQVSETQVQAGGRVGLRWPLIGRVAELDHIVSSVLGDPPVGLMVAGGAGVGKTRLAGEAVQRIREEPGWTAVPVLTSAGLSGLPYGALRSILETPASADLAEIAEGLDGALRSRRGNQLLLLYIDDAHLLDEHSARLIRDWLTGGTAVLLATVRSGSAGPEALATIGDEGLVQRIDLGPLSFGETAQLIDAALGSDVEVSTLERLWVTTQGNPLDLREVLAASVETGALVKVDGEWRWRGDWAQSSRLQEIVAERLDRLSAEELGVLETLAIGGLVPVEVLEDTSPRATLARLESRGLINLVGERGDVRAAIAHPVHAEVLKSQIPVMQARSICRNLADAAARRALKNPAEEIRLARWSIEAGIPVDPVSLRRAADATLWHMGEAIADRIQELVPGVTSPRLPVSAEGPAPDLAIRLATKAWETEQTVAAGATLAVALVWTEAIGEAEAVLEGLAGQAQDVDDRLRVAIALAHLRFWGQHRVEEALQTLDRGLSEPADPKLLARALEGRAGIELNIGRPAAAVLHAERAADCLGVPLAKAPTAPPAAAALSMLGRCHDALTLIDEALPVALTEGTPLAPAQLLLARAAALGRLGRLAEGLDLAETCRQVAIDIDSLDGTAIYGIVAGDVLLLMGRPASAARRYRDAAGLLAERDVLGYRTWSLAGLSRARAMYGDQAGAARALADAEAASVLPRYFDGRLHLARIEVAALSGRPAEAVAAARGAVEWAAGNGMVVDEALALSAWIRVSPDAEASARLAGLVARTDSPFVALLAEHGRAATARDPDALLDCAERLAETGARLMAAEAAAQSSRMQADRGRQRQARAAAQSAAGWHRDCENARSVVIDAAQAPAGLTRREFEVAHLALEGLSHKAIADRLQISIRTVDSHLYRTYAKLGITDRDGLSAALARSR